VGVKDHSVGNHPLWEFVRAIYQMKHHPYIIGGIAMGIGYLSAMLRRTEVPLSPELVAFVRREQMQRLKRFLFTKSQSLTKDTIPTANTPI
jgi:hypothetical protein